MKTLIIQYLPSGPNSKTKQLVDHYIKNTKTSIEILDLLQTKIPVFDEVSLSAYVKKCYTNQPLNTQEEQAFEPFLSLINQIKSADFIVIACPIYNFSVPGIVKCYLDAIIIKDYTFIETQVGDIREYKGALTGKKAMVLSTAGGHLVPESPAYKFNKLDELLKLNFGFIGINDVEFVTSGTSNPNTIEQNFANAYAKIDEVISQWHK